MKSVPSVHGKDSSVQYTVEGQLRKRPDFGDKSSMCGYRVARRVGFAPKNDEFECFVYKVCYFKLQNLAKLFVVLAQHA